MKILFVIKSNGKGVGGHYRSLKVISEEISKYKEVDVLVFGRHRPIGLDGLNFKMIYFGKNIYKILKEYKNILNENKYDIIHAFDPVSFVLTKVIRRRNIILNKCGGPNIYRIPHSSYLVVFSIENYDYYKSIKNFYNSEIIVIPNRVYKFSCDLNLIMSLKDELNINENEVVLLRIGRIDDAYSHSIRQSIMLLWKFKEQNPHIIFRLIIIGTVLNTKVFEELTNYSKNDKFINFVTDEKYTNNSKILIDIADIVIGTGRGFMEACYRKKILYAPISNSNLPILVSNENLSYFMRYNFSERTSVPIKSILNNYNFKNIIKDKNEYENFTLKTFNQYFNIETGILKYLELYSKVVNENNKAKWDVNTIYYFFRILIMLIKRSN